MHELPVVKSIFHIVLKHAKGSKATRVTSVNLEVGALSDLQTEWIQRYFNHLSCGTVAEGAKLNVDRVPAVFRCNRCRRSFEVSSLLEDELSCSRCHSKEVTLVSGGEYFVKNMEVR